MRHRSIRDVEDQKHILTVWHVFYGAGVLDSGGSDFEDAEEVFDAIGGVLQEVGDKNEDDIRKICFQMFNTLQL